MIESPDLRLILAIADKGSLSAAARLLHVTPSAISQRLTQLEQRLGLRIAERSGGAGLVLTAEGELLAQKGRIILGDIEALDDAVANRKGKVSGNLKVIAPLGIGRRRISALLNRFHSLHDGITVELILNDRLGQLPKEGWDVIIQVNEEKDTSLRRILLSSNRRVLCASPEYLKSEGNPEHPKDLTRHRCIVIRENDEDVTLWRFVNNSGKNFDVRVDPVFTSNDSSCTEEWAIAGKGILLRSHWGIAKYLERGQLVEILADWKAPDAPIVALTRGSRGRSARAEKFLEFLRQNLS